MQIKLKNSVVQDSAPSASDLPEVGELAVNGNINSIGGFMRASDNSIVKIFGPGSVTTPTATTTVSGIAELATSTETTTGTATNRVVTPAGLNAVTVAERTTSNTNYVAKAGSTLTGVLTMPNGSNGAPAINFGDSDSGIFGGTNTVSLAAGGTTRLTADTGVSVVGTLAVTGAITSTSDLTIADKIIHSGDTNTAIRFPAADTVSVETGGSERARIDSSGRLLIGTSSSRAVAGSSANLLQVEGTDGTSGIALTRNSANNGNSFLSFGKSRSASNGGVTVVQNNDVLGEIAFAGADGTDLLSQAAKIKAEVDGTPGSNDMPGRLVFSTTADGAASPTTRLTIDSAGLVKLPDNGKFVAGAGSDLQIYHDGSHNIINGATGQNLEIQTNAFRVRNQADSESIIVADADGSVGLYYNNSEKFFTTSSGISVAGNGVFTGNVQINDSQFLNVGNSGDLQIYHDGSHSHIVSSTGNLRILADGAGELVLTSKAGEEAIVCAQDGSVEIMYDNSKKFETTSSGAQCTGYLKATGGSGFGFITEDNVKFSAGTGNDLQIYHDGTHSYITNSADVNTFYIQTYGQNAIKCIAQQSVELYENGSKKFETTSTGAKVTGADLTVIGTEGISAGLYLIADEGDDNGDGWRLNSNQDDNDLTIANNTSGSYVDKLTLQNDGDLFTTGDVYLKNDSKKLKFGASDDLQIYHNGTDSYIENSTGELFIKTTTKLNLRSSANETMIAATPNAGVSIHYDNSKKLETTSYGAAITSSGSSHGLKVFHSNGNEVAALTHGGSGDEGVLVLRDSNTATVAIRGEVGQDIDITTGGNFDLEHDSAKFRLGADNDFELYHNGTNAQVDNSTGNLEIRNKGTFSSARNVFIRAKVDESSITCISDGAVELYYDNSKKLETDTSGVSISGRVHANGVNNIGYSAGDNVKSTYGNSDDLTIFHDGTNSHIKNDTGELKIRANNVMFRTKLDDETLADFNANGACELYHNNIKKFETTTDGATLTGNLLPDANNTRNIGNGTTNFNAIWASTRFRGNDNVSIQLGNSVDYKIRHDGTDNLIEAPTGADLKIMAGTLDNANETCAKFIHDGSVELYFDNSKKFQTNSGGADVTGDFGLSGELNLTSGGDKHRFFDCSLADGEALHIRSTQGGDANHENMAQFARNGASFLHFDNSLKLNTTNDGILVGSHLAIGAAAANNKINVQAAAGNGQTTLFYGFGTIDLTSASDERVKNNVMPTTKGLEDILKLRIVDFTYTPEYAEDSTTVRTGGIAQEWQKVDPNLVNTENEDLLFIEYKRVIPHLIKAVQELSDKVAALEAA